MDARGGEATSAERRRTHLGPQDARARWRRVDVGGRLVGRRRAGGEAAEAETAEPNLIQHGVLDEPRERERHEHAGHAVGKKMQEHAEHRVEGQREPARQSERKSAGVRRTERQSKREGR